ncbi:glycosyltransferase family 2 protein [Methylobacter luteus]|uniref:glycosyltransferase family 2 protein n=1 Tax=Methylobacter luteus TaxID=415 RepID=UPI0004899B29|nr:glycosyltransferase family 2 protein [Methylobacter luteus]
MANKISYNIIIVIVNYRTSELVVNCLESLKTILNQSVKVVVVDNSSGDNSADLIGNWISNNENAYLICSENNSGFSGGNNLAIESVEKMGFSADFIWLLNPDTVVRENALQHLLTFMRQNPPVGIAGSRLEYIDGKAQCSAFRFHSILSELDNGLRLGIISRLLQKWQVPLPISDVPVSVDWVAGASMLIRKQVFDDIGLFDDKYFLYFEETDFCLQAKRSGWSCWYVPASRVVHFVGSSTGVTDGSKKRRPRYWFESRQRYFLKNHGWFYLMLANLAWGMAFLLFRIRQKIQDKPDDEPVFLLRDFVNFNFFNK